MASSIYKFLVIVYLLMHGVNAFIYTDQEKDGWKGEEVKLRCDFSGDPFALFWGKVNASNPDDIILKASLFQGKKESFAARFTMDDDHALIIKDIVVSDEGRYICQLERNNGEDSQNSTYLTVNALASKPIIEQCEGQPDDAHVNTASDLCTIKTAHKFPNFNLDCKVVGFKPNITLAWKTSSGRDISPLGRPIQRVLPDGTFERIVTISVAAKNGTNQNFSCEAEGIAVNGKAVMVVTVLALPASPSNGGLSAGGKAGIAIVTILIICCVLFGLLIVLDRRDFLPPKVANALHTIPCLKREPTDEEKQAMIKNKQISRRDELREQIQNYKPGIAADITLPDTIAKVNINLFGEMSAGKSSFINTLNFAVKGVYKIVHEEGRLEGGGGKTVERLKHHLTEYINLVDNRGMRSLNTNLMSEINAQIRGKRAIDPTKEIEQTAEEECHCAVFVYHDSGVSRDARFAAMTFIETFVRQLHSYYGRSPMIVITHKDKFSEEELGTVMDQLEMFDVPEENIWAFENYTKSDHNGDVDKDIELLTFLCHALDACDRNVSHIDRKKGEKHVAKPRSENRDRGAGFARFLRGDYIPVDMADTPEPKEARNERACALM